MANEEHLAILRQGVDIWNQWRIENPEETPDLSAADLSAAYLDEANFSRADLRLANLRGAYLDEANFSLANLCGADLSEATIIRADLSQADLRQADLSSAKLRYVDIRLTNLTFANLIFANLSGADLSGADLSFTTLSYADLTFANLTVAKLISADLSKTNLSKANLSKANLSFANFTDTLIGWTVFGNVDLSQVVGLETIRHQDPSIIGIDTIYQSKGNIPYKFLLDAGVPKDDIAYLLSLAGKAIDFYSCFISYSSQDQAFAERLHADLQAKGVRCWYAPEDLTIGESILSGIDKGIRLHDKLLLVLSTDSVHSRWVEHEVEAALYEELRSDRKAKMLFPIRLDNVVMETDVDWTYRIRQTRHIGDFTQWKDHDAYQQAFERLLRDLKMGEKG